MRTLTSELPRASIPQPPSWRIFQRWGGSKAFVGIVQAFDRQAAIRAACAKFDIVDSQYQQRLVAEAREF
jgi:hypothetical protein